jgi:hypothetical protein
MMIEPIETEKIETEKTPDDARENLEAYCVKAQTYLLQLAVSCEEHGDFERAQRISSMMRRDARADQDFSRLAA